MLVLYREQESFLEKENNMKNRVSCLREFLKLENINLFKEIRNQKLVIQTTEKKVKIYK